MADSRCSCAPGLVEEMARATGAATSRRLESRLSGWREGGFPGAGAGGQSSGKGFCPLVEVRRAEARRSVMGGWEWEGWLTGRSDFFRESACDPPGDVVGRARVGGRKGDCSADEKMARMVSESWKTESPAAAAPTIFSTYCVRRLETASCTQSRSEKVPRIMSGCHPRGEDRRGEGEPRAEGWCGERGRKCAGLYNSSGAELACPMTECGLETSRKVFDGGAGRVERGVRLLAGGGYGWAVGGG